MSSFEAAAWLLTLGLALGCGAAALAGRTGLSLGLLLAGASLSGVTAPLAGIGVRIEQPAVAILALILVARKRPSVAVVVRRGRWPILFALVYLGANVTSAILFAPDRAQSLKICLWLAVSLAAAFVASVLVVSSRESNVDRLPVIFIIGAACLHAAVAIGQVGAELALQSDWGVLRSDAPLGKAFGLAWEPNLLAINLGAALAFLLDPAATTWVRGRLRMAAILLISVGIVLSLSRGGIIAIGAGAAVLLASLATRGALFGRPGWILARDTALIVAIALGGYAGISWLGTSGVGLRPGDVAVRPDIPQGTLAPAQPGSSEPGGSPRSSEPGGSPPPAGSSSGPATSPPPSSSPAATQAPGYFGSGETIELRWRNLQIAVSDAMRSPILGLGPDTFGQRYIEPTCACPAHIPNQLSATLYESGGVGLVSLAMFIGWVIVRGWRIRLYGYVAAVVAAMVGFQFTDALRFGATWIVVGTMIGLIIRARAGHEPAGRAPAGTPPQ